MDDCGAKLSGQVVGPPCQTPVRSLFRFQDNQVDENPILRRGAIWHTKRISALNIIFKWWDEPTRCRADLSMFALPLRLKPYCKWGHSAFSTRVVRYWNNLPSHIAMAPSRYRRRKYFDRDFFLSSWFATHNHILHTFQPSTFIILLMPAYYLSSLVRQILKQSSFFHRYAPSRNRW